MLKFAANLSLLFAELPFDQRFAAAARSGFGAVEILFPYDQPGDAILDGLRAWNLELVLINAPPPATTDDIAGFPAQPGEEDRFRQAIGQVMRLARVIRPGLIHVMSGRGEGRAAEDCLVRNLQWLTEAHPGQRFTIEPLNPVDWPGYFLNDYGLAARILDRVGRANLGLQFDSYHARQIHGDACAVWRAFGHRAFHVQVGQLPGRREPGPGSIDFDALFEAIDASGYAGWISAEYRPSTRDTVDSLGWLRRYGSGRRVDRS